VSAPLIRQAEPSDAAAIAECHVRTWQVAYRGQLPDALLDGMTSEIERRTAFWQRVIGEREARRQHQLVAVDRGRIVGFATFGRNEQDDDPSLGELYAIYLDPAHWGRGIGRALLSAAERGLREDGYRTAVLWVLESNARARRFYEIAGWSADGGKKIEHRGDVPLHEVRYRRTFQGPAAGRAGESRRGHRARS
jgi:GNAT superfamily N-acetyltransferase